MLRAFTIISFLVANLLTVNVASAQTAELAPGPEIRLQDSYTQNNEWYWKNNKPYAGYWQQDVHYKILAKLDDSAQIITGREWLTYVNNSPDTLTEVFFHLYQNAFQPNSYHNELYKQNKIESKYGKYEKQGLNTVVKQVLIKRNNRLIILTTKLNNTVLQVKLDQPLLPGQRTTFYLDFDTYFDNGGNVRRRMKTFTHNGNKHFDGVHWYPRIAVYDKQRKWNTDQHLNKELYGDYGTFHVELTLPSHYIAEATGILINENEVLPNDLKQKLDIKNFKDKKIGDTPSVIIPPDGKTKTWVYQALNVHDFAWTADPSYRISEVLTNNGVRCIAICQEENAAGWQTTTQIIKKVIETYSSDFGEYTWPKIVVADARDGMEYNMITLCGGTSPSNTGLIAHEVGHMWYYGIIGSNETYRAFMDEGFTQFLTVWFMDKNTRYKTQDINTVTQRDARLLYPYLRAAIDPTQLPLNTHSDQFYSQIGHGGGYGQVYYKTGVMLYNLQYVLGDSLFSAAMKNYYHQWMFKHPYPEDFRNSISDFAKTDLSWFFDQWLETNKTIDYSVKKVKKADSGYYNITFARSGRMQMPLDFTVELKSGKKQSYHIPNNYFVKNTDAEVLEPWTGWDLVKPEYTAHIKTDEKIVNVWIDTTYRLADINQLDNSLKPVNNLRFDNGRIRPINHRFYQDYWRPDIWYNAVDGVKTGLHYEGDYFKRDHFISTTIWYNSQLGAYDKLPRKEIFTDYISFVFNYSNPLRKIDDNLSWYLDLRLLDGLNMGEIGLKKNFRRNHSLTLNYKEMIRYRDRDLAYLLYPDQWNTNKLNSTINLDWKKTYSLKKSNGNFTFGLRTSAPGSDYQYATLKPELLHNINLKKLQLRNRITGFYTSGTIVAPESQLYLSQANPEEMMDNKFVRSRGMVPEEWLGFGDGMNHFHHGGGLNLRGFSGYLAPAQIGDSVQNSYHGFSGAAVNLELDFSKIVNFKPKTLSKYFSLATYMFFDAGTIATKPNKLEFSPIRMDAGLGTALTIKSWGRFQKAAPLTLRIDMPFYVDPRPLLEEENFQFRWIAGIGRAF
ncbi:MAG: M1 family aminopeptidase [Bacteroidia bacterium]